MKTWSGAGTPVPPAPAPLTDEQIIRVTMVTFRRYRPVLGVTLASHVAAGRMGRLYARRAS